MEILYDIRAALRPENAIAEPGYDRRLMPAAALNVHIPLGQVYAMSVFNAPLAALLHVSTASVVWIFSVAICFLGMSAALLGSWVDRAGPRRAIFMSASCFSTGLFIAGLGAWMGSLPVIIFGYGVVGGIGLGIGYIAPVSTLLKWFPTAPGFASGLAIGGFGAGALVGAPLAYVLMTYFKSATSSGIPETFFALGIGYAVMQFSAVLIARVPPVSPLDSETGYPASSNTQPVDGLTVNEAMRTRNFWLMWIMLLCSVSAGIGVIGQAAPMAQSMLGVNRLAGVGFVGLLALANTAGRFLWAAVSDKIGRKAAYAIYFGVGALAYWVIPIAAAAHNVPVFIGLFALVLSFYGAGFATAAPRLADLFGARFVGPIHGRLLTAWSVAAVLGAILVSEGRDYLIHTQGLSEVLAYASVMHWLAGLLVIGFVCNFLLREPRKAYDFEDDTSYFSYKEDVA